MSTPDFGRAEYVTEPAIEGEVVGGPTAAQQAAGAAFPMAVLFGAVAAVGCSIAYAFIWQFGVMFSIVAIGFAWVIANAMLKASGGYGGRLYQIVASVFTYFTITCGKLLLPFWQGLHNGQRIPISTLLAYAFFGPILRLQQSMINLLGILVIGYAVRAAWQYGKGTRNV